MKVVMTGQLQVPDDADLEQLHTWFEDTMEAVEDSTVVSIGFHQVGYEYRVVGTVRGKPDESWEKLITAESPELAAAAAVDEDDSRAVADVQPTGIPVPPPPPMPTPDAPDGVAAGS